MRVCACSKEGNSIEVPKTLSDSRTSKRNKSNRLQQKFYLDLASIFYRIEISNADESHEFGCSSRVSFMNVCSYCMYLCMPMCVCLMLMSQQVIEQVILHPSLNQVMLASCCLLHSRWFGWFTSLALPLSHPHLNPHFFVSLLIRTTPCAEKNLSNCQERECSYEFEKWAP